MEADVEGLHSVRYPRSYASTLQHHGSAPDLSGALPPGFVQLTKPMTQNSFLEKMAGILSFSEGEFCRGYFDPRLRYHHGFYCPFFCCGEISNKYCCKQESLRYTGSDEYHFPVQINLTQNNSTFWVMIGVILGTIILIAMVILAACFFCCRADADDFLALAEARRVSGVSREGIMFPSSKHSYTIAVRAGSVLSDSGLDLELHHLHQIKRSFSRRSVTSLLHRGLLGIYGPGPSEPNIYNSIPLTSFKGPAHSPSMCSSPLPSPQHLAPPPVTWGPVRVVMTPPDSPAMSETRILVPITVRDRHGGLPQSQTWHGREHIPDLDLS